MHLKPATLDAYRSHTVEGRAGAHQPDARAALASVGQPAALDPGAGPEPARSEARGHGVGAGPPAALVDLSPEAVTALAQKTLETEVGEQIAAAFAEVGVDLPQAVGQDWSVDATAQRIVDFSTGLYETFREQHAELSDEEAMTLFEETLRGAVDEGYGEAIEILRGMSVSDEVLGQAEATIARVHELFDEFFARAPAEETPDGSAQADSVGADAPPPA